MQIVYAAEEIFYDGSQLRSGWIAETFAVSGDALAVFTGGCDVKPEHMLDLEDLAAGAYIRARRMLHFIVEHCGANLPLIIARQRLLVCLAYDLLRQSCPHCALRRCGDDLYVGERKLSVSVAAASPRSGLIHLGLNLDPSEAPVSAISLYELGLSEREFAPALAEAYLAEMASCEEAANKVRPAR